MKRFIKDIKRYRHYLLYTSKSDLRAQISQSYLSWLWWILDPLLFMLVYTFVSVIVFGNSEQYFSAFIFIGYTSYKFFDVIIKKSIKLIRNNKGVLAKIYLPKHMLLLSTMIVESFTTFIAYFLVVCAMILYKVPVTPNVLLFFPLWILLFLITFSFSVFFLHFGVYIDDLSNVMNVVLRLIFYMSGIFYSIPNRITDPLLQNILVKANPVAYIIDQMRNCMLYGKGLDWATFGIWFLVSFLLSAIGVRVVYKNENNYVKMI